jgi:hypothetical protein
VNDTRAIVAAIERLRVLRDHDQPRVQGALSEATTVAREAPQLVTNAVRRLVETGTLQRLWDAHAARAEVIHADPTEGLKATLLGTLEHVIQVVLPQVLGEREISLRHESEALALEIRTLEWVTSEARREPSSRPPSPPQD